jgi:hypothetical protein
VSTERELNRFDENLRQLKKNKKNYNKSFQWARKEHAPLNFNVIHLFSKSIDCNLNNISKIPTYILLLLLLLVGCTDLSWQPPDPGTVMAEL